MNIVENNYNNKCLKMKMGRKARLTSLLILHLKSIPVLKINFAAFNF